MSWLSKLLVASVIFAWGGVAIAQPVVPFPSPTVQDLTVLGTMALKGGALTVGTDSTTAAMIVNGPAGSQRTYQWNTAGVRRWFMMANATPETGGGSNSGSDLQLFAATDTGAVLAPVMTFTRATGDITFNPNKTFTPTYTFNGDVVIPGRFGNQLQIYSGTVTVPAGPFAFNQNPMYFNFNYASSGIVTPSTEMFLLGFNLPSESIQLDDAVAANNLALIWAGWQIGGPGSDPANATAQGQRLGIDIMMRHNRPANPNTTTPFTLLGQRLSVLEDVNTVPRGGVGGSIEGIDLVITRTSNSTGGGALSMAGIEVDMAAETNALPPLLKYGAMIYSAANDAHPGTEGDAALHFASGNLITGWLCQICLGKPGSPSSLTPTSTIFGTVPYHGQDGLVQVNAKPPSPVNLQAKNGIEFSRIVFNGAGSGSGMAFAAPGFVVDDLGATYHTSGKLLGTSTGLTIDTPLYALSGTPTVVAGSTTGKVFDGDYAWDETCKVRGIYQVSVVNGVVTAVSVIDPSACASSPATIVLKSNAGGVTINTTWTPPAAQVISLGASAGVVQMATATALKNTTVGALPACNTASKYQSYVVSDANAPTYGGPLTGNGTAVAVAVCDGTGWKAH